MKINFQHKLLPIDKICLSVVTTVIGLGILGISNEHAHANTTTVNKTQPTTSKTKASSAQVKQPVKRQITVQPKNIKKVSSKQPVASVKKVKQPTTPVKPLTTKTTPKQTTGKVSKTYVKPLPQKTTTKKTTNTSKPVQKPTTTHSNVTKSPTSKKINVPTTKAKPATTKITPKQTTGKVSKTYVKPAAHKTTTKKTTSTSKPVQKPTTTHSNVTKSPTSKKINVPTTKAKPATMKITPKQTTGKVSKTHVKPAPQKTTNTSKPVTIKTTPKQTMGKVSKTYTKPVPQKATTTSKLMLKPTTSVKTTTPKTTTATNSTLKSTSLDESKTIASPTKSVTPINKLNVANESKEVPNTVADNIVATTEPMSEIKAETPQLDSGDKDYYKSMTQLFNETTEGVDWKKDTRNNGSAVLIVAPHGGGIEQGSSELTKLIANQGNYDFFSFEGIRPSNNSQLHVTSTHYDDPTLSNMIENRKAIISIHGAAGNEEIVYLGGMKSALRDGIQQQLEQRGFKVEVPPTYLGGAASKNFINTKANNMGVQIELTNALRKKLFQNGNMNSSARKNVNNWTSTMYDFSTALNNAIQAVV